MAASNFDLEPLWTLGMNLPVYYIFCMFKHQKLLNRKNEKCW